TFEDLPADVSVIDPADYMPEFSRSRKYVAWALRKNQGKHVRKDTKREGLFPNCPATMGGIRPASPGEYYKAPFGCDDLTLAPWKAAAVSTTESVATVSHDLLVSSQEKDKTLFASLRGWAGVYFRPSSIGGDGYRLRAQVHFEKFTNYELPNLETLKAR